MGEKKKNLHAKQYEFAALQQCNRSQIATLGKRQPLPSSSPSCIDALFPVVGNSPDCSSSTSI